MKYITALLVAVKAATQAFVEAFSEEVSWRNKLLKQAIILIEAKGLPTPTRDNFEEVVSSLYRLVDDPTLTGDEKGLAYLLTRRQNPTMETQGKSGWQVLWEKTAH